MSKKRILTGTNDNPLVNCSVESDDDEGFRDRLEVSPCLRFTIMHIYMFKI